MILAITVILELGSNHQLSIKLVIPRWHQYHDYVSYWHYYYISIGSSLRRHFLLLLSISLLLLPSFNTSAIVTSAAFVAAAFIDTSLTKFQQTFSVFFLCYKDKLARYFLATLHKVPGVMVVPRTATYSLSIVFSSYLTHCKHTPTAGIHTF